MNQAARIAKVAPILTDMIKNYNAGDISGAEAYDAELYKVISEAGLIKQERRPIDHVAIHPGNRESTMLVPVDTQDLLMLLVKKGWNPKRWNAMACTVPACPEGDNWRKKKWPVSGISKGGNPSLGTGCNQPDDRQRLSWHCGSEGSEIRV